MTTAVVAPLPVPSMLPDMALSSSSSSVGSPSSDEARKRRREILSTRQSSLALPEVVVSCKKRKEEAAKRPQMKYDPSVPMSKEEAAAWRREQRRMRNRESAAASRQRQRDRIEELQQELDHYKTLYEETQRRIKELTPITRAETPVQELTTITPRASPTASKTFRDCGDGVVSEEEEELQPPKMTSRPAMSKIITLTTTHTRERNTWDNDCPAAFKITIPAVKITGSAVSPLPPLDETDSVLPDPILSDFLPIVGTDESVLPEEEAEFGEFLLDAVDWL